MARKSSKPVSKYADRVADSVTNPKPIILPDSDGDTWLHYHTDPLAYPVDPEADLFDVWQVDPWLGEITRVAAAFPATHSPLTLVRDYFWSGDGIAFLTPHIDGDEIEHFLQVIVQLSGFLQRQRDCDFSTANVMPPPLRKCDLVTPKPESVKEPRKKKPSPVVSAMKAAIQHSIVSGQVLPKGIA